MKTVGGYVNWMPGGCGVTILEAFEYQKKVIDYWSRKSNTIPKAFPAASKAGAGWQIAAFVNDDVCKAAYEKLLAKGRFLVFQSPVRENSNSGNEFFFCVYSKTKVKDVKPIEAPGWPFKDTENDA